MTEYALSVFGMCALLGALSLIHYNKDGAERSAQRVLFAAALVLPLLNTAVSFDGVLPSLPPYSEEEGEYSEVIAEAFCDGVGRAVRERYSLPDGTVRVEVTGFDPRSMRAEKIEITLSGRAITIDRWAIKDFIEGEGLGECEVRVSVG